MIILDTTDMESLSLEIPDWWARMSHPQREKYLKLHPKSKFVGTLKKMPKAKRDKILNAAKKVGPARKTIKRTRVKPALKEQQPNEIEKDLPTSDTPVEQIPQEEPKQEELPSKDLEAEEKPNEPPVEEKPQPKVPSENPHVKKAADTAYKGMKYKLLKAAKEDVHGLKSIGKFLLGRKLGPAEKKRALKVTGHIFAGMLIGLGAVALFTPLQPLVGDLARLFLNRDIGTSSNSSDDEEAEGTVDSMYSWLMQQDIPKLTAQLKAMNALRMQLGDKDDNDE